MLFAGLKRIFLKFLTKLSEAPLSSVNYYSMFQDGSTLFRIEVIGWIPHCFLSTAISISLTTYKNSAEDKHFNRVLRQQRAEVRIIKTTDITVGNQRKGKTCV